MTDAQYRSAYRMYGDPWENLAIAIIASGYEDSDTKFLRGQWCRDLCELLGIDPEIVRC